MFAHKITYFALGLGIVACSKESTPETSSSSEDRATTNSPSGESAEKTPGAAPNDEKRTASAPRDVEDTSAAPEPECPTEVEPNNEGAKATAFTKCIFGALASQQDSDFLKVTAPEDVAEMVIDHVDPDGPIQYTVTIAASDNQTSGTNNFNMSFTDKAPKTKVRPGTTYMFGLRWDNGSGGTAAQAKTRNYALRVTFQ